MVNQGNAPNIPALKDAVEQAVMTLNIAASNLSQASPSSTAIYTVTAGPFGAPSIALTFADYVPPPPSDEDDPPRDD